LEGVVKVEASCAWGDGPDVLVEVESGEGYVWPLMDLSADKTLSRASFGVNSREARALAAQLLAAADRADELERGYFAAMREPPETPPKPHVTATVVIGYDDHIWDYSDSCAVDARQRAKSICVDDIVRLFPPRGASKKDIASVFIALSMRGCKVRL
jgi:hypothetical protein